MATEDPPPSPAEAGRRAYREGRFAEAAERLHVAVLATPHDATLRLMLARCLEQDHRADLARQQFRFVLASAPDPVSRRLAFQALATLDTPGDVLVHALIRSGKLTQDEWAAAQQARRADESMLAALLRQTRLALQDLILARFGPRGLPAGTDRPLVERLGARLVTSGHASQVQIKQALMTQVATHQPLGEILCATHAVRPEAVQQALAQQVRMAARLTDLEGLGPLLIRWGVLTPEAWHEALKLGGSPARILVSRKLVMPEHLQRVQRFQQAKVALLAEHRFRLGSVLIEAGVIAPDALARALASQLDQPFPLGEVLIMQRLCSPEAVLEGLMAQQRRYDEAIEATLPPLPEPPPPPPPAVEDPLERQTDWRRRWLAAGLAAVVLYAAWYGTRYGISHYGWLGGGTWPAFSRERAPHPEREAALQPASRAERAPEMSNRMDPLELPDRANLGAEATSGMLPGDPPTRFPTEAPDPWQSGSAGGLSGARPGDPTPELGFQDPSSEGSPAYPMLNREGDAAPTSPDPMAPMARGALDAQREPAGPMLGQPRATREGDGHSADPMRRAEGVRTDLPPGVPPPPAVPMGASRLPTAADMDDRAVDRSTALFRYRLGVSDWEHGKYQDARQEFNAALKYDPGNPLTFYYLGRLAELGADPAHARRYYEEYLRRMPNGEHQDEARFHLGRLTGGGR